MKLQLLTLANPKTAKGAAQQYLTAVLHLAPYKLSGVNVCPMAEIAGCVQGCLNTAGRGGIAKGGLVTYESVRDRTLMNPVQKARIRRTRLFIEHRETFMSQLMEDITRVAARAAKLGLTAAIRLNGTSDIRWEDIPVKRDGRDFAHVFAAFPDLQFYDYTKIPNRTRALRITNYHLTFSYSGAIVFRPYVERAIANYGDKVGIAVVFDHRAEMPREFLNRPVVNGDEHDLRFLDPKGSVVGLKAKGKAKNDSSGFVVRG